jgi:hypothetical protein
MAPMTSGLWYTHFHRCGDVPVRAARAFASGPSAVMLPLRRHKAHSSLAMYPTAAPACPSTLSS